MKLSRKLNIFNLSTYDIKIQIQNGRFKSIERFRHKSYSAVRLAQKQGKPGINLIQSKPYIFEIVITYFLSSKKFSTEFGVERSVLGQNPRWPPSFRFSMNNSKTINKFENM